MGSTPRRFVFTPLELSDAEIEQRCANALRRHAPKSQPVATDGLAAVVATFAAAVAGPEIIPAVREYRPREVGIILAVFAALVLAFDSEGLLTWVQRMEVGPAQSTWRAVLNPMNAGMGRLGLTRVRRWTIGTGERVGRALGVGEDPLLAEGWAPPGLGAADVVPASAPVVGVPAPLLAKRGVDSPAVAPDPLASNRTGVALDPRITDAEPDSLHDDAVDPRRAAVGSPVNVLLVGDSMIAGSLATAITRALGRDARLRLVSAFQLSTGLSRPDIYDWMKVLPPLLDRERPQLIVCSMGANDSTNIQDGDQPLEFGSSAWRAAYSERVLAMMRVFSSTHARVLWLGLPPMREARFSAHAAYLNGIFSQSAQKVEGVEFLELRMLVSDGVGDYSTFVTGPDGRLTRYRLDDGIHYSPAGARTIARWVVDWVYERYRKLPAQR